MFTAVISILVAFDSSDSDDNNCLNTRCLGPQQSQKQQFIKAIDSVGEAKPNRRLSPNVRRIVLSF